MMRLSARHEAIVSQVTPGAKVLDVGTDHGFVAIALLKRGIAAYVAASDVNEGPLARAKENMRLHGVDFPLYLADGIIDVPLENIDTIIIAGMGGETIIHILEDCPWIKGEVNLILQPMTKASLLREWLCGKGFDIHEERIVSEGKFFYTVIKAVYSGAIYTLSDFEKELGRPDWSDETVKKYGRFRLSHYRKLSQQMSAALPEAAEYYGKLAEELAGKCSKEEDT